ncbi:DNA sulfur modification protein DndD [Methylicorpusculum sp.]|uniref:DNA sulfur modification protein DndD n=2 Tax=Methylicorpusculum sp. TaxID=2713644 RepID=UPI00272FAD5D|nr:DNA sulfur modification protein DndD [Methylicorpusculum sp.]MDP2180574.1 DNA sulfur modification protein DndD [Methylicorpusculum sp.]MDP3527734.1 DNA sulfur modification protein DndD [Methylicorpusculum sp.]
MYFKSLTITNLFSYYDKCEFNLTPNEDDDRNIVVIQGRNGHGKTSFLNSVKMLYIGVSDEIRRTAQRKRIPTERQYVCGIDNELWGILNQQARQEGTNTCGVKAVWESDEGEVIANRTWTIDFNKRDYEEKISVITPFQGELVGKQANDYLDRCLPKSYIPFFFFDGEEVQALAEANDNEVISKMELLLNIKPLENMQEALKELRKNWNRGAMSAEKKLELTEKENQKRFKEQETAVLEQKIEEHGAEVAEIEDSLTDITRKLRLLRGAPEQASEINIKAQIQSKNEQLQECMKEVTEAFQRDAFLRVTPDLLAQALKTTEALLQKESGTQLELIDSLKQELPEVFTRAPFPTPRLEPSQIQFYQQRITRLLESYAITDQKETAFHVDGSRARRLSRLLSIYQPSNKPHLLLKNTLAEARELNQTIQKLELQLKDAGDMSNRHRAELINLQDQEEKYKERLLDLRDSLRRFETQKQELDRDCNRLENEISGLEGKVRQAGEMEQQLNFVDRLRSALNEVKERLKREKRAELEASYNRHLKQLLDSNSLIDQIKINDHFEISYLDAASNTIGMSTVSAGMKQLSATALLWGLKEVSARELPIVIDTPMGRIDRQHQDNLLQYYYPKIGRQVILLPTDSELDERKHELLKPYIFREYHLSNATGKNTSIQRII